MSELLSYLPHLNAFLNGTSAILLICGYLFIRRGNIPAHRTCQISALIVSNRSSPQQYANNKQQQRIIQSGI